MLRLAPGTQVREESWGLLFYAQDRHKVSFVKSGGYLLPAYFQNGWEFSAILADIASRTGSPRDKFERQVEKLLASLLKNGLILDELR
jgi:putative mycofactocin binding protein MftB